MCGTAQAHLWHPLLPSQEHWNGSEVLDPGLKLGTSVASSGLMCSTAISALASGNSVISNSPKNVDEAH